MADIVITVYGTPAPQGSKRAFAVRGKGGIPTGRVAVIESSHDRVKSWRQAVIDAAEKAMAATAGYDFKFTEDGKLEIPGFPLRGPLEVTMAFYLKRPKSHFRTGRNAELLRDSAPPYPDGPPDTSKLLRATEDALTAVGAWADDAQAVKYSDLGKYWCAAPWITPGAHITIRPLMTPQSPVNQET